MRTYDGSCHCGRVRFRVTAPLAKVVRCNCSICGKKGFLHLIVPPTHFELLAGAGDLTVYTFNTGVAQHQFCRHCGIHPFYVPRSDPDKIDVNVRCLEGVDVDGLEIGGFDGANWEQAIDSASWKESDAAVDLRREEITSPVAAGLIAALNAELSERYREEGANHFRLDAAEVAEGRGAFVVARIGGEPGGCGALRRIDAASGEIKRMYVAPSLRGRGVGARLLAALEAEARRLGLSRIVLETGTRQPEALGLYRRAGYVEIPPFGEYVGSPLSVCMEKRLAG
jgi:N-acetylglutamate synthase-like GNAT family acetyltransferase